MREFRKQDRFWIWASSTTYCQRKVPGFRLKEIQLGKEEAAKQALAEDSDLLDKITTAILEKVQVTVGAVLAQGQEDEFIENYS